VLSTLSAAGLAVRRTKSHALWRVFLRSCLSGISWLELARAPKSENMGCVWLTVVMMQSILAKMLHTMQTRMQSCNFQGRMAFFSRCSGSASRKPSDTSTMHSVREKCLRLYCEPSMY